MNFSFRSNANVVCKAIILLRFKVLLQGKASLILGNSLQHLAVDKKKMTNTCPQVTASPVPTWTIIKRDGWGGAILLCPSKSSSVSCCSVL